MILSADADRLSCSRVRQNAGAPHSGECGYGGSDLLPFALSFGFVCSDGIHGQRIFVDDVEHDGDVPSGACLAKRDRSPG